MDNMEFANSYTRLNIQLHWTRSKWSTTNKESRKNEKNNIFSLYVKHNAN